MGLLAALAVALALGASDPESDVAAMLDRGATVDEVEAIGAEVATVLGRIARSMTHPALRRERAVTSLGALEAPEAAEPLRSVLGDSHLPLDERCLAASALARHARVAAVADLSPLLHNPVEALRVAAARGLGAAGGDDAKKALEDRLELEETPLVREAIQNALTRMLP